MNLVAAVALVLAQGRGVDSVAGRVRQLADSYLAAYFERHPDEATLDGVAGGPDDRLPDDSPLALAAWQAREDAWLAELRAIDPARSEEHTSELQSRLHLVCRLLLEKKKKIIQLPRPKHT